METSSLDTFFTLNHYRHGVPTHAFLMTPDTAENNMESRHSIKGVTSLVPTNGLVKRMGRCCLGCEGLLLQSSQLDLGHGVAKPSAEWSKFSQFAKPGEWDIDIS